MGFSDVVVLQNSFKFEKYPQGGEEDLVAVQAKCKYISVQAKCKYIFDHSNCQFLLQY